MERKLLLEEVQVVGDLEMVILLEVHGRPARAVSFVREVSGSRNPVPTVRFSSTAMCTFRQPTVPDHRPISLPLVRSP